MKKSRIVWGLCIALRALVPSSFAHAMHDQLHEISLENLPAVDNYLSDQDHAILAQHKAVDYAYIPDALKTAITHLKHTYTDLEGLIDLSPLLLNAAVHVAAEQDVTICMEKLTDILNAAEIKKRNPTDPALKIIEDYVRDLASGDAFIFTEQLDADHDDSVRKKKRCKTYCNLIVRNCLRAGNLTVTGNAVIDGTLTVDGTVINNYKNTSFKFPDGTNGQLLIGKTGGTAQFATVTSSDGSILFTPGPGTLKLGAAHVFGNVARVDQIFGNDSTGKVSGPPFLTIGAALTAAAAYASGPVVVWIFPGVYNEAITIPDNVSVVGMSEGGAVNVGGVTIQQTGAATTLVTMGQNTLLENVTLQLAGNNASTFTGIDIPTGPANIDRIALTVDNSSTGTVYGILASGTTVNVDSSHIVTISAGTARGIYVNGTNNVVISNSAVTTSGSDAIGVETVNYATFTANASIISGASADISETVGTITVAGTTLTNSSANLLGFTTTISPVILAWGTGAGNYHLVTSPDSTGVRPGTAAMQVFPFRASGYNTGKKSVVKDIYMAMTAPMNLSPALGSSNVIIATIPSSGLLFLNFQGSATSANVTNETKTIAAGSLIAMQGDWTITANPLHVTDLMVSAVLY